MSAFIGNACGPHSNSPAILAKVHASISGAEMTVCNGVVTFDPIAARNLAALLVRAADECARMRNKDSGTTRTTGGG